MNCAGLLLFSVLACVVARTHAESAPVQLLAVDGAPGSGVPMSVEHFAAEAVTLHAVFLKNREAPADIACDVFADGDALAAPFAKDIPFVPTAQAPGSALLEGAFTLHLPELSRAKLRVLIHNRLSEKEAQVIARLVIWITPKNALRDSLAAFAKKDPASGSPRLMIFGPCVGLRDMLRSWHISFEEGGEALPTRIETGVLAAGDADDLLHPPTLAPKSSLLVFHPDPADGVEVSVKLTPQTCFATVRLPAAQTWSDSAFLHRQFIAQIQRHLDLHE